MATADTLRNSLIDKLLTISNKEYLIALNKLIEKSAGANNPVDLSIDQIQLLKLSDDDIAAGKLIPQEQLDKSDLEWLKGK